MPYGDDLETTGPERVERLQVCTDKSLATAIAAIIASWDRAADLRPPSRSDAATEPNSRAAAASNGSGSKSASAACKCAWRAARSSSDAATNGPTDNSASVTAVITGSSGNEATSAML